MEICIESTISEVLKNREIRQLLTDINEKLGDSGKMMENFLKVFVTNFYLKNIDNISKIHSQMMLLKNVENLNFLFNSNNENDLIDYSSESVPQPVRSFPATIFEDTGMNELLDSEYLARVEG